MNLTDDRTIRAAIKKRLIVAHTGQDAVIVEELKVSRGAGRMDVAVVNGRIEGYEIKSDKDTLERLPKQAELFGVVADRMTLVVGERHADHAILLVPGWWSVLVASLDRRCNVRLKSARRGKLNRATDQRSLILALERDEITGLLSSHGLGKGMSTAPYGELVDHAVAKLAPEQSAVYVRKMLKLRASFGAKYQNSAFGRSAIICSAPCE